MFFNWYVKSIRFPSGTGNTGLDIVPTNCGCLRCHRSCFKSRIGLGYLSSSDVVKSSLLLLPLPAAPAMCVSPYGCLRSWSQNSTWGPSGSQQYEKAFTCPQNSFAWKVPYRSIKKSYLSYFYIFQTLKKEQDCLTLPNLEPSFLFQSYITHLPDFPSEMGQRKPGGI